MDEQNTSSNSVIWAFTILIIVAIIVGALYFSGMMGGSKKTEIDVNISVPSR